VVVVVSLVDGVTVLSVALVPLPGPPIAPLPVPVAGPPMEPELVLPDMSLLVVPGVVVPMPLLLDVEVSPLGAGVVVDELDDDDVSGVGASSRLVQAPSETAAISARAAQEVREAFIGKLLMFESIKGSITALSAL
jgi:hypothetical protein